MFGQSVQSYKKREGKGRPPVPPPGLNPGYAYVKTIEKLPSIEDIEVRPTALTFDLDLKVILIIGLLADTDDIMRIITYLQLNS